MQVKNEDRHGGDERQFVLASECWHSKTTLATLGDDVKDEITLSLSSPDGGTSGEFNIRWEMVGGHWTPKINAYCDSWSVLREFSDVFEALADFDTGNFSKDPSPKQVCEALLKLGFRDATPRKRP